MKYWPLWLRVVFRFVFCYYALYMAPAHGTASLLESLPFTGWLTAPYMKFWDGIQTWVAVHVFHLSGWITTRFPTGSGDTTLDYIMQLCVIVVALAGTLVWSILDRKRLQYRTLHAWLRLFVRYTLAFTLFSYGFAKVFPLQFRTPGLARLMEPYGEFTPMGSLWWFMGASTPYIIFSGSMEVLGGVLLLFRRTTTLGAMACFAVLANVVALNYCYDVPVKLYSSNLLLMAVFLMAPDMERLWNVLVRNRPVDSADWSAPSLGGRKTRFAAVMLQVLVVGFNLYGELTGGWQGYQSTRIHPKRPPLYGLYMAEEPGPWWKVAIDQPESVTVRMPDDSVKNYRAKYDEGRNGLTVWLGTEKPLNLTYSRPDAEHLVFDGAMKMKLKKIDVSQFPLLSRGFHWINERPLNR